MTSDPDDAELIARSLGGDEDAFVEVVRRHEAAVGAYLARRAGRDRAEDLLGEVWVAAFTSRAAYDRSFPGARPWLFGVAHNTLRRHWRSRPAEELVADVTGLASGWDPWTAVDRRVDAESVLRQALARLPLRQREILTLVAWEDLTVADAGRVLGMPPGTARRVLHEARRGRDAGNQHRPSPAGPLGSAAHGGLRRRRPGRRRGRRGPDGHVGAGSQPRHGGQR